MDAGELPGQVSAVVIGGGVMGCSTLYHLAKAGCDAVLLERNRLGSGTSWHSAAQVRALRSDRGLTDLIRHSIELYTSLEAETGQATGWIGRGSLSIACNDDRMTHIRRQHALARAFGLNAEVVSPDEARERWPLMRTDDVVGAVWSPDDGRVGPSDLVAALAKGARRRGARIFEETPVAGIRTRGGRAVGVETARGTIRAGAVVVCSGLWSRRVAAMAGASAPLWPCEHFYLLTEAMEEVEGNLPTLSDHDSRLYIRDDSGGLLVGCFEPMGKPIDPDSLGEDFAFGLLPEDWEHFEPMMRNALHRVPRLAEAGARMLLNGPESFTPDGEFILGESVETPGLFLGCGMNSVGVASAGGAGMALAHAVTRGHMPFDLHAVHPGRFAPEWSDAAALAARAPEVLGRHYEIRYPGRQWTTARDLRAGPLRERWTAEAASLEQWGAWERPAWFGREREPELTFARPEWHGAVGREVAAAHGAAAVFDLSTLGKIRVEGPDAEAFLDRVCANAMRVGPGRIVYTGMLNERGGYESDLTVFRLSPDAFRLHVGTTALARDLAWLRRHVGGDRVTLRDETGDWAILALTGPEAGALAPGLPDMPRYRHAPGEVAGVPVLAAGLSYVGEPGWELSCAAGDAVRLWDALRAGGARPAGLMAQTSMRIEKRFLAYGHDLDSDVTPLDAGLGFAVDRDSDFIGREALLGAREAGPPARRMMSFLLDDGDAVPLGDETLLRDGEIVGRATSAAFGHRVGRPVALGYVESGAAEEGARFSLDIAGREEPADGRFGAAFAGT